MTERDIYYLENILKVDKYVISILSVTTDPETVYMLAGRGAPDADPEIRE